ncbi:hypothetical protein MKEN_00026600 [Mycena kentingensis (nom. inval.)]|nr:hypothetical protein MKEN_00026600 [Mycena kentingensis (nom. inval.)]
MQPFALDLDMSLGAYELGVLIAYILFGIAIMQTYVYFMRFTRDSRLLRALVAFVGICEVGHTLCIGDILYRFSVVAYGQPTALISAPTSFIFSVLLTAIISACVQGFFAHRIYIYSRHLLVPSICTVLISLYVTSTIAAFALSIHNVTFRGFTTQWQWLITTSFAIGIANDVLITGTLMYLFARDRECSGSGRRQAAVNRLLKWTLESGLLNSIFAILKFVCFLTMKDNFIVLAVYIIEAKVNANSLLASLNGRHLPPSFRTSSRNLAPVSPQNVNLHGLGTLDSSTTDSDVEKRFRPTGNAALPPVLSVSSTSTAAAAGPNGIKTTSSCGCNGHQLPSLNSIEHDPIGKGVGANKESM